jgi:hypothetical protein
MGRSSAMNTGNIYVRTAIIVAVVAALGLAALYYFVWRPRQQAAEEITEPVVAATPAPEDASPGEEAFPSLPADLVLASSDEALREVAVALSSHPKLAAWLANEDLVRRFTATAYNLAAGKSPRSHLDFLRPRTPYTAIEEDGAFRVDPKTARRYDLAAEVFRSLDTDGTVRLYREVRPLIDEAFKEIAPPGASFDDTLKQAIFELLRAPKLPPSLPLEEKVVTYSYQDEELEALSSAQRHLLRMGPDNVARIQAKLRELATAIGIPEEELPETPVYEP